MMKLATIYCFMLVSVCCWSQGHYTDRVSVSKSDGESYALYLPENYNAGEIAPVLIVFAPNGVGRHGVAPFKKVADERGMIVVSSNDCRNGPYEENLGFAQRLFDHIFSQYAIDPNQIFLSGFSGGSRLASAIASLSGNIAGVVACGASFSGNLAYRPESADGYVWLGIVGDRDFNYQEMLDASSFLNKLKYPNGLQVFSGSHQWPPPEEITAAFRFMELQLHTQGRISLLPQQIKAHFKNDYHRLSSFIASKDLIKAAVEYERMRVAYSQVKVLDTFNIEKREFLKTLAYKKQKNKEAKALALERALKQTLRLRFEKDFKHPDRAHWKWWENKISKLKETSGTPIVDQMRSRVLYWLYVMTVSGENPMLDTATKEQLAFGKKIVEIIRG